MIFVLQVIGHKISLSRGLSRPSDGHSWSHTANLAKKPITSSLNIEQHSLESISQSRWSDTLPATPDLLFKLNATFWDNTNKDKYAHNVLIAGVHSWSQSFFFYSFIFCWIKQPFLDILGRMGALYAICCSNKSKESRKQGSTWNNGFSDQLLTDAKESQ